MDIALRNVVPKPLEGNYTSDSIWGKDKEFKAGKYYLVKASSGKGKSTLISYLFGTRSDFSGTVLLNNKDTRSFDMNDWSVLRQEQIAIVFQDLRLFDELSAYDNIIIKQQLTKTVKEEEIRSMAQHLGIEQLLDKPVKLLSMGQQQRVALIRALVQPFKWLLLDEPFSHLDAENTLKMEVLIEEVCKRNGAGLILTSLGNGSSLNIYSEVVI
ncbi:MAG: ATP-binding cassette domain-containing protein [Chitinophagaceae bacterium]